MSGLLPLVAREEGAKLVTAAAELDETEPPVLVGHRPALGVVDHGLLGLAPVHLHPGAGKRFAALVRHDARDLVLAPVDGQQDLLLAVRGQLHALCAKARRGARIEEEVARRRLFQREAPLLVAGDLHPAADGAGAPHPERELRERPAFRIDHLPVEPADVQRVQLDLELESFLGYLHRELPVVGEITPGMDPQPVVVRDLHVREDETSVVVADGDVPGVERRGVEVDRLAGDLLSVVRGGQGTSHGGRLADGLELHVGLHAAFRGEGLGPGDVEAEVAVALQAEHHAVDAARSIEGEIDLVRPVLGAPGRRRALTDGSHHHSREGVTVRRVHPADQANGCGTAQPQIGGLDSSAHDGGCRGVEDRGDRLHLVLALREAFDPVGALGVAHGSLSALVLRDDEAVVQLEEEPASLHLDSGNGGAARVEDPPGDGETEVVRVVHPDDDPPLLARRDGQGPGGNELRASWRRQMELVRPGGDPGEQRLPFLVRHLLALAEGVAQRHHDVLEGVAGGSDRLDHQVAVAGWDRPLATVIRGRAVLRFCARDRWGAGARLRAPPLWESRPAGRPAGCPARGSWRLGQGL